MTAEVLDKFSELITTALGLVAALAWNEAIQQLFTLLLGDAGGALAAKFFYAFLVTLVVIFATISVSRAAERAKTIEAEQAKSLLGGLGRSKEYGSSGAGRRLVERRQRRSDLLVRVLSRLSLPYPSTNSPALPGDLLYPAGGTVHEVDARDDEGGAGQEREA